MIKKIPLLYGTSGSLLHPAEPATEHPQHIVRQFNSDHILKPLFVHNIHPNVILLSVSWSNKWSLPS